MILKPTILLTLIALVAPSTPVHFTADSLQHPGDNRKALYGQGVSYESFLENTSRRRQIWLNNDENGEVSQELLQRARSVEGTWRLLAVAEDWCSDSAGVIPYLADLVNAVDALEMRIIDSKIGAPIMEAHKTPDGRTATPTVVLLDQQYEEVGCFVERPDELQEWALAHRAGLSESEFMKQKTAWYDDDFGRQTMRQIVELLEKASAGTGGC